MSKLANEFWGRGRFGGLMPGNGGGVRTTNPKPLPEDNWRPEQGTLQPSPGQYVGSEPGGPSSSEPVDPNRGGQGI
jgi:hypothetical protein